MLIHCHSGNTSNMLTVLLFFLFLVEYTSCQGIRFNNDRDRSNDIDDRSCPRGFACDSLIACLTTHQWKINGQFNQCGRSTQIRQVRICCPQRLHRSRPQLARTTRRYVPTRQSRNLRNAECGKGNPGLQGFVLGGVAAKQGAWPWMVLITKGDSSGVQHPSCTAFLIDRRHVVSAAHCFKNGPEYRARIGHVNMNMAKEYTIQRIIVHSGYAAGSWYDDIALLTLTRPVDDPNFAPICPPWGRDFKNITGMGTTIVGWGSTREGGHMSTTLQQLHGVPIVSNNECSQAFRRRSKSFQTSLPRGLTPGFICAGFMEEWGKDTCQGDSGGPLMFHYRDQWYAVGIVSFGYGCGHTNSPGAYTRVSEYVSWINKHRKDV